nr:arginine--tRNA ligase [Schwartzia sp. (in: firmicutes)]
MDMKEKLAAVILAAAKRGIADGVFPEAELPAVELEVPPKKEMGDFATNFAMKSAKAFRKSPRQIAEALSEWFARDGIERVEIAGPGFINFYLTKDVIYDGLRAAVAAGED